MPTIVLTFESVHLVIKADKLLSSNNIICKIIPVPEQISSECGMCIETNHLNRPMIEKVLNQQHIAFQANTII